MKRFKTVSKIKEIPHDCLEAVFLFCEFKTVLKCRLVSKDFYRVSERYQFFKRLFDYLFANQPKKLEKLFFVGVSNNIKHKSQLNDVVNCLVNDKCPNCHIFVPGKCEDCNNPERDLCYHCEILKCCNCDDYFCKDHLYAPCKECDEYMCEKCSEEYECELCKSEFCCYCWEERKKCDNCKKLLCSACEVHGIYDKKKVLCGNCILNTV